ncbi:MAG: segregation/condensation protein A [Deltaproteobacteria bacterium]|jgi:segregation and condensation protein A|nr:segregation/condensation protein A [Deltaproteobacteria bacterium]PNV87612.1 MAG: chromosome segregation protein ScpA [Desulfobacteraceae bacterium]MDH3800539.1 segregation/condensation protein A [Deltaproteobacteria bacterium]MDH3850631.1 segregation/condensation protein A [Deltaproteobacteria bacterium]MDH3896278.1 segregation/condensation protein A [Deltaproteobacteria bacterium]
MTEEYQVQLEIFEGPMDLLLHLIRKNKVDIYDIPIALIMDQFLAHLDMMRSLNIDVAGEFLETAATLAYIKSRLLVPRIGSDEEEQEEDPRLELVRPLLEYAKIREAAQTLADSLQLGRDVYVRNIPSEELWDLESGEEIAEVGLFELVSALHEVMKKAEPEELMQMRAETMRLKDRINQLMEILAGVSSITFHELFAGQARRAEIIVTFLAILEVVRLQMVRAFQHQPSGIIRLYLAVENGIATGGD